MAASLEQLNEYGKEFDRLVSEGLNIYNENIPGQEFRKNSLFKGLNDKQYKEILYAISLIHEEGHRKLGSSEYNAKRMFYIHYSSTKN
jgi:hypothetical protein